MDMLSTPRSTVSRKVFEEVQTPITDFSVIERQKENIRPSATGRSAATLSSLFEMDEAAKIVNEGHEMHRKAIEEAERRDLEGEEMEEGYLDILDVYNRYITFTNQHHPSSSTHILPLLERTARKFVDDRRYSQDIRLLRIWVQYARYTDRREEIWSFLETKEVGTNHAEFYEQWATSLEAIKRKKKADDVYRLGIARRAAPLERLKNRHQAYLARIMAPPDGIIPDDEPIAPPRPSQRSVLGQVDTPATSSGSLSGATQVASSSRSSRAPNGAKMEIFADGVDGRGEDGTPNEWNDFGTRDSRRKENVMEATSWKGETLPQKRVVPRTPKVEVFRDANENESVRPAEEHLLRIRAPQTEAELLKHDPLRNFDLSGMTAPAPPVLPPAPVIKEIKVRKLAKAPKQEESGISWSVPTDGPVVKDAKGKSQKRMFDWNAVYKNDDEWSFEEVRARQRGLLGKEWRGEVQGWEMEWHSPGASTPKKEPPKKKMPSPTVNTKLAQQEVEGWFNQTIHGGKVRHDSDSEDEEEEDDEEDAEDIIPPTPLPAPGSSIRPPVGMVPPTPTPNSIGRPLMATPAPMVYNDENAMAPPSTNKKFNIFSATPAKTPLAPKTPLAVSSAKPKAFEIFSGIAEEDERDEIATPSVRRTALAPMNIFATPALGEKTVLSSTIAEEAEEEVIPEEVQPEEVQKVQEPVRPNIFAAAESPEAQGARPSESSSPAATRDENAAPISTRAPPLFVAEQPAQPIASSSNIFATPAVKRTAFARRPLPQNAFTEEEEEEIGVLEPEIEAEQYVNINDEDEEMQGLGRFKAFPHLTPIAERTCEYTSYTQYSALRQSESSSRRFSSAALVADQEANEGFLTSTEPAAPIGLSAVEEEEERSQSIRDSRSARQSVESSFFAENLQADQSGTAGSDFALPEGFTIHGKAHRESGAGSVVVLNGETMRSREGTVESERPEGEDIEVEGTVEGEENDDDTNFVTAQHGQSNTIPNPCNPIDDDVLAQLLDRIEPPLASLPGYHDHQNTSIARLDALSKHTSAKPRRNSAAGPRASIAPEQGFILDLGDKQFEVKEKIGEGGYGAVFLGVDVAARQALDDVDSDDEDEVDEDAEDRCMVAIKVERPGSVWESVILHRLHSRLDTSTSRSIVSQRDLYAFADESYLLLDYSNQGTLLDVVNKASSMGIAPATTGAPSAVDEMVAIYFTIELLRTVETLHRANFIHGDLKIDNCMVRLEDLPNSAWSTQYDRSGGNGWSSKGIKLIDFGRGIDLELFGPGQKFVADWKIDQRDCVEMRKGESWTYETDYFGLAGICYCLLFGRYIGTTETGGKHTIDQPLKRYWQAELWNPLFETLLNPKQVNKGELPVTDRLSEIRELFESWLEDNCQKGGKSLRAMLKKIELATMTARRG